MTFRKYSKLTSSSPCALALTSIEERAEPALEALPAPLAGLALVGVAGDTPVANFDRSGDEDAGPRLSIEVPPFKLDLVLEVQ